MEVREEEDQPSKKQIKTQEPFDPEKEKDRISLLPDSLIIDEILSRLESTRNAIRTGTLSKRWQHLWPLVPSLFFSDSSYRKFAPLDYYLSVWKSKRFPDFYLTVDQTLAQCQLNNLYKFRVSVNYDNRFESHVENWIHFAISRNVQQIDIYLRDAEDEEDQFELKDDSFFVNSHFTRLELAGFVFNPTASISWNNLTHLSISYGNLDEDLIANILSGSPLLDTLILDYCYGFALIHITSKSVKNLVLCGYNPQIDDLDDVVNFIDIIAPYLSSLTIMGDFMICEIWLDDVSSLVKAELNYTKLGFDEMPPKERKAEREDMLETLILRLKHVEELKIGISCLTVFSRLEAKGFIFPSNLKVVQVDHPVYDTDSTELGDCSDNDSCVGDSSGSVLVTQLNT